MTVVCTYRGFRFKVHMKIYCQSTQPYKRQCFFDDNNDNDDNPYPYFFMIYQMVHVCVCLTWLHSKSKTFLASIECTIKNVFFLQLNWNIFIKKIRFYLQRKTINNLLNFDQIFCDVLWCDVPFIPVRIFVVKLFGFLRKSTTLKNFPVNFIVMIWIGLWI